MQKWDPNLIWILFWKLRLWHKQKKCIFCIHFLVDSEFGKMDTTHLFSPCDLWTTPSSTRNLIKCSAFQKSRQIQPCFLTFSGKHRTWNVWKVLCRRKQCRYGEVYNWVCTRSQGRNEREFAPNAWFWFLNEQKSEHQTEILDTSKRYTF